MQQACFLIFVLRHMSSLVFENNVVSCCSLSSTFLSVLIYFHRFLYLAGHRLSSACVELAPTTAPPHERHRRRSVDAVLDGTDADWRRNVGFNAAAADFVPGAVGRRRCRSEAWSPDVGESATAAHAKGLLFVRVFSSLVGNWETSIFLRFQWHVLPSPFRFSFCVRTS